LLVIKSRLLPGAGEVGRSSKGGVLKAGSIIGQFTMAWRRVAGGAAQRYTRGGGGIWSSSGMNQGHRPPGGPIGPHGLRRLTGHLGQMRGKEFLRI
jgi:hypothetical protein